MSSYADARDDPEAVATLVTADPVSVVRSRLEAVLERLTTTEPSAIELIRINRILDTAERILRLPRLSPDEIDAIDAVILSQQRDTVGTSLASVIDQNTQTGGTNLRSSSPQGMVSEAVMAQIFSQIENSLGDLTDKLQQRAEEADVRLLLYVHPTIHPLTIYSTSPAS